MKRLAAVLLLVVSGVVLLCLGATERLTNRSGAPTSGVVITFSEAVRITSCDKSAFPTQSPASGEAESFTFSGGALPTGEAFQLAWAPSTARVVSSSWVTGPAGTQGPSVDAGTKWRGVCARLELLGPRDLQVLAEEWNVNLLRLYIGMIGARGIFATLSSRNPSDPVALPEDLARLDEVLDQCARLGIAVIISLVHTAGYQYVWKDDAQDSSLWKTEALQRRLVQFWEVIAQYCADRGNEVYGYDLLSEPHNENGAWNALAKRLTQAMRAHDTTHAIIVESVDYAGPKAFSSLVPTGDPNTIYSFHFYLPDEFVHQGERGLPVGAKYPTQVWNRAFLERQIQPVIEFQQRWHVPILVGEFGSVCAADPESRAAYFEDCMSLFEDKGFDYCYYAYRDSESRSLEHDGYQAEWWLRTKYVGSTPALDVALRYFASNIRSVVSEVQTSPKCLFDESHWPAGTTQYARDRNVRSEQLAWRVSSFCDVTVHASGAISSDDLTGIGLLVLGRVTVPLTAGEIAAIESFVAGGGSVLVYADVGVPESVNSLLGRVGIRFDNRLVVSSNYDWDPPSFWVPFAPDTRRA
jgi:hypothetical protein